jgi:hypothetical protein
MCPKDKQSDKWACFTHVNHKIVTLKLDLLRSQHCHGDTGHCKRQTSQLNERLLSFSTC